MRVIAFYDDNRSGKFKPYECDLYCVVADEPMPKAIVILPDGRFQDVNVRHVWKAEEPERVPRKDRYERSRRRLLTGAKQKGQ